MLQNRTAFDRIAKETSKTERAPAKLQREKKQNPSKQYRASRQKEINPLNKN